MAVAPSWMAAVFEALDYGVVVLAPDGGLEYANSAAGHLFDPGGALWLDARGHAHARAAGDDLVFQSAIQLAAIKGGYRLLQLGHGAGATVLALTGLGNAPAGERHHCLLLTRRPVICERLSMDHYARLHGLTPAEGVVLELLSQGLNAKAIAVQQGVMPSTTRSHIRAILGKLGVRSVSAMLRHIATLPPVVGGLGHAPGPGHTPGQRARERAS